MKNKLLLTCLFCMMAIIGQAQSTWSGWYKLATYQLNNGLDIGSVYINVEYRKCIGKNGVSGWPIVLIKHDFKKKMVISLELEGIGCDGKPNHVNVLTSGNYILPNTEYRSSGNYHQSKQIIRLIKSDVRPERTSTLPNTKTNGTASGAENEQSIAENEKIKVEINALINQLPANERRYFQGRVTDISKLAQHYQQKNYDQLRKDVSAKIADVDEQSKRKAVTNEKRIGLESGIDVQIDGLDNVKDKAELSARLDKLKENRSSATDMEYALLESDVRNSLDSEKRVKEKTEEFKNTYNSQNSDFKSRSGAMQTNAEMNKVKNDPSLSNAEKEAQIVKKQEQLNKNISIYNDDAQRIDQQKEEISEIQSENQAKAGVALGFVAILATVLTLGAVGQEVGEGHAWTQDSKIHPSFYVGASAIAVPLVADYHYWNEYNDGTLTSGAKTVTQETQGHKVVASTGLGAGFQNEFLLGSKAGLSLFAEVGYHFINVEDAMNAIVDAVGGDSSAGTTGGSTTYGDATSASTSKTSILNLGGGVKGYIGAHDRPKLLWEASVAQNTGTHSYTYKYQYTGSGGDYSNVDTFHSGSIDYQMFRAWLGCRFGDISNKNSVLLDVKAGKEFTTNPEFSKSAPWLLLIGLHKPHRFMFSIFGTYGYFEDASVSFSNKFNIGLKLARTFDWYK